ncbi:MAG: hypothetical protein SVT52_04165 [Planctomycetota bacterium]|nr:hypothetical protein [Planctomycetota bacterium]
MIVVHVTHETVQKIGGIGAVIAGLMTADAYTEQVSRTIILGPLFQTDHPINHRLGSAGKVLYSSPDMICPPPWREKFRPVEQAHDVGVIYGTRKITDPCSGRSVEAEILVIDVSAGNRDRLNRFKGQLYEKFAVPSGRFEDVWEYEQYIRLAEPGFEALQAIGCGEDEQVLVLAHEYMGVPTALKAVLDGSPKIRTVFYAHEVASVRPIVEKYPGHDTMFYNVLHAAAGRQRTLEQVFPEVSENFKHPLVKAGRYCDHVFAVGDRIAPELRFLEPHFRTTGIDLVYNGVPALPMTPDEKLTSRARMKQYASNLLGFEPAWIFTHVARPVVSKGIWRDLRVLHELEPMLAKLDEKAVYFMLGTLGGQRHGRDIRQMENRYGWPVHHEIGYPDLCGGEEVLGEYLDSFNRNHGSISAVLVNQWDWNRQACGERMPQEMTFADIRSGTDLEFGLSVYEPFGISQLEPLSAGALCIVSSVCGCMGYARRAVEKTPTQKNIIEADFLGEAAGKSEDELLQLGTAERERIENAEARRLAGLIIDRLPRNDQATQRLIDAGYALASQMSWQRVVQDYFLPSLGRAAETH